MARHPGRINGIVEHGFVNEAGGLRRSGEHRLAGDAGDVVAKAMFEHVKRIDPYLVFLRVHHAVFGDSERECVGIADSLGISKAHFDSRLPGGAVVSAGDADINGDCGSEAGVDSGIPKTTEQGEVGGRWAGHTVDTGNRNTDHAAVNLSEQVGTFLGTEVNRTDLFYWLALGEIERVDGYYQYASRIGCRLCSQFYPSVGAVRAGGTGELLYRHPMGLGSFGGGHVAGIREIEFAQIDSRTFFTTRKQRKAGHEREQKAELHKKKDWLCWLRN